MKIFIKNVNHNYNATFLYCSVWCIAYSYTRYANCKILNSVCCNLQTVFRKKLCSRPNLFTEMNCGVY